MLKASISEELHFSGTQLGAMDTAYLISYAIASFLIGQALQLRTIKKTICYSLLICVALLLLIAFLCLSQLQSFWPFILCFILFGISISTVWPGTLAIMSAHFDESVRGSVLGIWCSSSSVGQIVSCALVVLVINLLNLHWTYALVGNAVLLLLSAVSILFIDATGPNYSLQEPLIPKKQEGLNVFQVLILEGVVFCALMYAGISVLNYTVSFWFPLYVTEHMDQDVAIAGTLQSLYGAGTVGGSFILGILSDKVKNRCTVILPLVVSGTGLILLVHIFQCVWLLYPLMILSGIAIGGAVNIFAGAVTVDVASKHIHLDKDIMATICGIFTGIGCLNSAMGQFIAGLLYDVSWDYVYAFMGGIGFGTCAMLVYYMIRGRAKKGQLENNV